MNLLINRPPPTMDTHQLALQGIADLIDGSFTPSGYTTSCTLHIRALVSMLDQLGVHASHSVANLDSFFSKDQKSHGNAKWDT